MCDARDQVEAEDEMSEELRVIARDGKKLPNTDRAALSMAAEYIDWQNIMIRRMRAEIAELYQQRDAQLDTIRELRRPALRLGAVDISKCAHVVVRSGVLLNPEPAR